MCRSPPSHIYNCTVIANITSIVFFFFHPTGTFLSTFTLTVAPFLTLSPVFVSLSVCRTCINILVLFSLSILSCTFLRRRTRKRLKEMINGSLRLCDSARIVIPGCQPDSHGVRALLRLFSSCPTGLRSCTASSRGRCGSLDFPAKFVSFIRRALTLSAAWLDLLLCPIRAEFTNFSWTNSKPHSASEGNHEMTAFHVKLV